MRRFALTVALASLASPVLAAGGGAGAGGAGHQRAINSGLPAGEAGPSGAPNNRRPSPKEIDRRAPGDKGTAR